MSVIVANCRFDSGGSILLPFLLESLSPDFKGLIYEGKIDTGFNGYIMMPFKFVQECRLNLNAGFGSWTMADGTQTTTIDTIGKASVVGRAGLCIVNSPTAAPDCDILIGQKMLEAWSVRLESDLVNKVAQLIGVVATPPAV